MKKSSVLKRISIFLLSLVLVAGTCSAALAADIDSMNDERKELEAYLKELVVALDSAGLELSDINSRITETDENIEKNTVLLEDAEKASEKQRRDMKKRIKYLYEAQGDMSIIEAVLTAESIGDAISKTSYVSKIVDYDRKMMDEYIRTINSITDLKTSLEEGRVALTELKEKYGEKGVELSAIVAEVPEKMAEFGIEEDEIGTVIEEFRNENPELLTAAEEAATETEDTAADTEAATTETPVTGATEENTEQQTETEVTTTEAPTTEAPTTEAVTEAATTEPPTEAPTEPQTQAGSPNSDPVWNLARITYLENGVMYPESSYKTIYLTACVVINRANAWFGGSIMDSIYAPGAYATAYKYDNWVGGELVINDITWQAVNEALANPDPNVFYQANGDWLEGMGLTEYYRDPTTNEVFYTLN